MLYIKKKLSKRDINNIITFGVYAFSSEGENQTGTNNNREWTNPIPVDEYQSKLLNEDFKRNGIERGPNFRADHSTPFFEIPENHPVVHAKSDEERYIRNDKGEYEQREELSNTPEEYLIKPDYYDVNNGAFRFDGKESEYVIKKGDNLSKIAKHLKVPVLYLQQSNNLNNRSTLQIGQKLKYRPLARYDLYSSFTPGHAIGTIEHEGFTAKTKKDSSGRVVGGFGHSPIGNKALKIGVDVSREQALKWWNDDVNEVLTVIRNNITNRGLTKDQLDALVDWGYHKGASDLRANLIPLINKGLMKEADDYMFKNVKNEELGNELRKNYRRWKIRSAATFPTREQLRQESMLNNGDPNQALPLFRRDSIPVMKFKSSAGAERQQTVPQQAAPRRTTQQQSSQPQASQSQSGVVGTISENTPTISHLMLRMKIKQTPENIRAILEANPGKNPKRLRIGDKINIPASLLNNSQR